MLEHMFSAVLLIICLVLSWYMYVSKNDSLSVESRTSRRKPTVHMLSGMVCSGKSSVSQILARRYNAIVFSPDTWVQRQHGPDFCVSRFAEVGDTIKNMIFEQVKEILIRYQQDVILDFSLWEHADRENWRVRILEESKSWNFGPLVNHVHFDKEQDVLSRAQYKNRQNTEYSSLYSNENINIQLHFMKCDLTDCKDRLAKRNTTVLQTREYMETDQCSKGVGYNEGSQNFFIAPSLLDEWCKFLQNPTEKEFPIIWENGKITNYA